MPEPTTQAVAEEAAGYFETVEPDDRPSYVRTRDGSPQWLIDLIREAHCGGGMLPDDWRYGRICSALEAMAEADHDLDDDPGEWADGEIDIRYGDLAEWAGSHGYRFAYCNEAAADGLVSADADLGDRLQAGQYVELREIWASVRQSLAKRVALLIGDPAGI